MTETTLPASPNAAVTHAPMSAAQRLVARVAAVGPVASRAWNEVRTVHLQGVLDVGALERALAEVAGRHDAFGMVVDGGACFGGRTGLAWSVVEGDAAVHQAALLESAADLAHGPLVRAVLVRAAADDHQLLLWAHHVVFDGWSFGVLIEDLAGAYGRAVGAPGAVRAGDAIAPVSFLGFLAARGHDGVETRVHAARRAADLAWWEQRLGTHWPTLDLPSDRPRRAGRDLAAAREDLRLEPALAAQLKSVASRLGVGVFSAMCGVYAGLVARLAGAETVAVAVPAAAQTEDGLERLIGHGMVHLPLMVDVSMQTPAAELLRAVQAQVLDAYDHLSVGLEDIVERYAPDPDPTRLPLARVKFNFNPSLETPDTGFAGLSRRIATPARSAEFFELFLNVEHDSQGLQLACQYETALFDAATVRAWLGLYAQALQRLVERPEAALAELYAPTADDLTLLAQFNARDVAFDRRERVEARIARQALAMPDAPACTAGERTISYRELDQLANGVAARLVAAGVQPGDLVGLCCARTEWMLVGLHGVWKAGAGYVPLDPGFPADRLDFMAEDSELGVVLTDRASLETWRSPGATSLLLDETVALEAAPVVTGAHSEMPAYVIFTSGSTGRPKGVRVPHRSVCNLLDSVAVEPGMTAADSVLAVTTLSFDIAVSEVILPLTVGARIVMADHTQTADGLQLRRLVEAQRVSFVDATPATWRLLLGAGWKGDAHLKAICTGEPLPPDLGALLIPLVGELWNGYGPTETTVWSSFHRVLTPSVPIPIGRPVNNTQFHVLDAQLRPVPVGVIGELWIGGEGVTLGYLKRPDLTDERFIPDPFAQARGLAEARMYKTGDLGRWRRDGILECLGRSDHQVKVRGYRIELGEIEVQLCAHAAVDRAVVITREDSPGDVRLVAYLVMHPSAHAPNVSGLRAHLMERLPDYMVPQHFVVLDAIPLLPNGKINRHQLPKPATERPDLATAYRTPATPGEVLVAQVFGQVLGLDGIGADDNFFELGGNSLLAMQVLLAVNQRTGRELSAPTIFAHPTPGGLAAQLDAGDEPVAVALPARRRGAVDNEPIAVVGMTGRFPGANSVEALWQMLVDGRDGITRFTLDTLDATVSTALRTDPDYVMARGIVEGVENFDHAFFGLSPREAEMTDPQHRLFLEIAWECLERAGYAPDRAPGLVGVFAGVYTPSYLHHHVMAHPEAIERLGDFQSVIVANDKDYVATRVAYKLNLKGPAVAVHTACSTSLVAIAQAVDSLRLGRCDMALAGGASVSAPPQRGYLYEEGAMLSPDAQTRAFDADAQGTAFNDGAAVVLLKRLSDALADGDTIHALIRGIATNNDGGGKASFTAPSVDGQAAVVAAALEDAQVDPRSISYVEAHGTATPIGDPVEVEGLTRAWRRYTPDTGFCRIGSVKSNIGHLITAAGATGVIKTALSLRHELMPAVLHYQRPNPKINFARSPFTVVDQPTAWPRAEQPRRAGVSSFGVGGTNAHAVLEEPPLLPASSAAEGVQLLMLSARSKAAVETMAAELAGHLEQAPETNLADVAHTLQVGRSRFAHRIAVVASTAAEAAQALRSPSAAWRAQRQVGARVPGLVWVFPGQGAQYAGMGRQLHAQEPAFRAAFDECAEALADVTSFDLRRQVFEGGAESLVATEVTQPATFCLEYALAQLWWSQGLRPAALIGHSVGEFVAAVLAGVMPLRDAARLVARRGALMQSMPAGSMLSVRLSADQLEPRLPEGVCLAAENGPSACVVAGPTDAIQRFVTVLEGEGIVTRALQTSHAFHSSMMDAAVAPFEAHVREVALQAPQLPLISTLTGTWMSGADATDAGYWSRHLRAPVRFSPAVRVALAEAGAVAFLEIGPRGTLSTLVRQHGSAGQAPVAVASLGDQAEAETASVRLARAQLWTLGLEPAGSVASPPEGRRRIELPTYAFERKRCWLEAGAAVTQTAIPSAPVQPAAQPATVAAPVAALALPVPPAVTPPTSSPSSSSTPTAPAMAQASTPPADRRPALVSQLRVLFEDIAGMDFEGADASASFVELGLDSLTLTQTAIALKKKFAVAVTFRQLMETFRSFDTLAEHLDRSLPKEAAPAAPATATPVAGAVVPAVVPAQAAAPAVTALVPTTVSYAAPADAGLLQQVIAQQMQLMSQQLALLGGAGTVVQTPAAAAVAQPTPVAAAAATVTAPAAAIPAVAPTAVAAATAGEDEAKPITYDVKKAFGAIARIHTQAGEMSERSKARLDAFIRRYIERTAKSKAYTADHRDHLADPRVVNGFRPATKEIVYQIVVDKTKGSKVWDIDGNEYVDALNGFGMSIFGWQPDFLQDAVREQLDKGYEIGPMHPLAGEVAKLMCELTGFERAGLCNTGSEAVMAAIRIARTVTGRSTIVSFTGSYHGTFDEVLVRAGRHAKGIPAAPGIMPGVFGDIKVLDYGTPEALAWIREHAEDLAAVLVEPVQSRRPDFQPKEFLKEVRAITEQAGTCLIFDEVITGFRSHPGGAQALFDIRADLASYGKVIGGGFPVGVIAGKREYMDALDGGQWQYGDDSIPTVGVTYFAGTFVRHPLALAAAKASLEHFKKAGPELQAQLNLSTAAMADELNAYCREVGAPLAIRYFASLWRVTWLEDHPMQDLLFAMMRSRGVHILDNFPCFLTTAHTPEDIAKIKQAFKESIAEMQEGEFLPRRAEPATVVIDASRPPVPNARLGRDKEGRPAWFVPDPVAKGKFVKVNL